VVNVGDDAEVSDVFHVGANLGKKSIAIGIERRA
jgi:hypothetical protein